MVSNIKTACLGFPRVGKNRELKFALEKNWKGVISESELRQVGDSIKLENWKVQAGLDYVPSNDFSFYDFVLDIAVEFGIIPSQFRDLGLSGLELYFAMARGYQKDGTDVQALEMTKWFDTNYHYIVPNFSGVDVSNLKYSPVKIVEEYKAAKSAGFETRPVVVGVLSFLLLSKLEDEKIEEFLPHVLSCYESLLKGLEAAGCTDVQIDEPCLVCDLSAKQVELYESAYSKLTVSSGVKLHLATYFDIVDLAVFEKLAKLPFASLHVDLTKVDTSSSVAEHKKFIKAVLDSGTKTCLSVGVVDGRNVWINDLSKSVRIVKDAVDVLGAERVIVGTTCSLALSPYSVEGETEIDSDVRQWLSFAVEKVKELELIAKLSNGADLPLNESLESNLSVLADRASSSKVFSEAVGKRVQELGDGEHRRNEAFSVRKKLQADLLKLPKFPTTTIGSFPQTAEIRKNRNNLKKGKISEAEYIEFCEGVIRECVDKQEEIGLDVFVHGECERNDMVEYFAEYLDGFTFTANGWVQSYGSRCVKPPVIFGDVSRARAMTVRWSEYAQKQTEKPMKAMLTGPITIMKWSFVRDDVPLSVVCNQIAIALQEEVHDLEDAGIKMIQIDEPAIREALPLKGSRTSDYLKWSVRAFRISARAKFSTTQIHTHMCYSEFGDILKEILDMDADVISIETSRSQMELLNDFAKFNYSHDIGPGVYDIHSPRTPSVDEMVSLLQKALKVLPEENIWANPDCGLKTRTWKEVIPALENMVLAAKKLRGEG